MSEEQTPSVEEIKERLKVEIPVEEEATKGDHTVDVAEDLRNLGRQFAETLQSAWNSEERQRMETEVKAGLKSFVNEVDKAFREVKASPAAEKVKESAVQAKERIDAAEVSRKARSGFVQGLHWLSEELGKLADQFTPAEKAPEDTTEESE